VQNDPKGESTPGGAGEADQGVAGDPIAGGAAASSGSRGPGEFGGDGMGGMGGVGVPMSGGMSPMPAMPGMGGTPGGMGPPMGGTATYTVPLYDLTTFTPIVHCTITILFGILGGIIARWLYATGHRKSPAAPSRAS
jgi:hypothetical protein